MKKLLMGIFLMIGLFFTYSVAMAEIGTEDCPINACKCKYEKSVDEYTSKEAILRCFIVTGQTGTALKYAEDENLGEENIKWAAVADCHDHLKNKVQPTKEFMAKYKLNEKCEELDTQKAPLPKKVEKKDEEAEKAYKQNMQNCLKKGQKNCKPL